MVSAISLGLCITFEANTHKNERSGHKKYKLSLEQSDEGIRATDLYKHTLLSSTTVLKFSWRPGNERMKKTLYRLSMQINEATKAVG